VVASNDGFAKAKAFENKQELVLEQAQELVKDGGSDRCGRHSRLPAPMQGLYAPDCTN
jgi:hypothetical protein